MKVLSSRRRIVFFALVMLLTLFLLRPGASRMKSRISGTLSSALGRSVEIGSVHIRLLPRPAFDLENLVIYDDPAFGSEPMLRAAEVTAALRLTSLARGRIEIARLDLTDPSFNLVQGENGRWNLESLLERSAHIPIAPTAKAKSEARPGFPYIEASSARINFKRGQEKKPYALTNADFSLWQDSENAWGVRLRGQPIRTDLNLNDTGVLRVSGSWRRAESLRDTPLEFEVEWDRPQLGQLTKLFSGRDSGWRGTVQFASTLTGTPGNLRVISDASVEDFRRYDITTGEPLRLAGHCDAKYSSVDRTFRQLLCTAPRAEGNIVLKGEIGLPGSRYYALQLSADEFPARSLVALVQRAKKNLSADLTAEGTLNGSFSIRGNGTKLDTKFSGQGEIANFHLTSAKNKYEVGPETIPFTLNDGRPHDQASRSRASQPIASQKMSDRARLTDLPYDVPYLDVGPLSLGQGNKDASAHGWINASSYRVAITGEADVARTLSLARMLGLAAVSVPAAGHAQLDLSIAGSWRRTDPAASGFVAPPMMGTARLRDIRMAIPGTEEPLDISSAELQLTTDAVRVVKLSANAAGTTWTGSFDLPRGCSTLVTCPLHFSLNGKDASLKDLVMWVNPDPKARPWYGLLTSNPTAAPSVWMSLHASGRLTTNRLTVKGLEATRVATNVTLENGKLHLSEMTADLLGGKYRADWRADFGTKPATYTGTGSLNELKVADATEVENGPWSAGTGEGSYQIKAIATPANFWQSADGSLRFNIRNAGTHGLALGDDAEPLKITRFAGLARLHGGRIELHDAQLESSSGKFEVTGTASLSRELDLRLTRKDNGSASGGYVIAGTLDDPRVTPSNAPPTEDQLKAQAAK